jgi:hypothetical protein
MNKTFVVVFKRGDTPPYLFVAVIDDPVVRAVNDALRFFEDRMPGSVVLGVAPVSMTDGFGTHSFYKVQRLDEHLTEVAA